MNLNSSHGENGSIVIKNKVNITLYNLVCCSLQEPKCVVLYLTYILHVPTLWYKLINLNEYIEYRYLQLYFTFLV